MATGDGVFMICSMTADLANIRDNHGGVRFSCNACGRSVVLDVLVLILAYGERAPVPSLARKARCSHCGSRDVDSRPDYPPIPGKMGC